MSKHTPEPWRVIDYDEGCVIYGPKDELIETFYGESGKINARRIVACVNKCAGTSTELLSDSKSLSYSELQRQNAELLETLEDIIANDKTKYDYTGSLSRNAAGIRPMQNDRWKTPREIAEQAIAKAKGEV